MAIQLTLEVTQSRGIMVRVTILMHKLGFKITKQTSQPSPTNEHRLLNFDVEGSGSTVGLPEALLEIDGVLSIIKLDENVGAHPTRNNLQKKAQCKKIIETILGASVAESVDDMSEEECVALCRAKVKGLVGENVAKVFDKLL